MIESVNNGLPNGIAEASDGFDRRRFDHRARLRRAAARAARGGFFQPVPTWLWLVSGLAVLWGVFTVNPVVTVFSILLVPALASLLWFKGEPPAMLLACGMQWLQASAAIYYCNEYGAPLDQAAGLSEFSTATWLSLLSVLVLALGMRLALLGRNEKLAGEATAEAVQLQPTVIFVIYAVAFVFLYFLGKVAFSIPQLTQPLLALGNLRWMLIFLLGYSVLQRGTHYYLLALVFFFELIFGFLGFFSGFKGIFLMMLAILPCTRFELRGWRLALTLILGTGMIALSIIWTAIKTDYREFLNQGSDQQVVVVSIPERVEKLGQLFGQVDMNTINEGLNDLILRVTYVNYFALSMRNVPEAIPHEHGKLWFDAIRYPFMPRLFFPNKPILDDSVETEYYTGYQVAGAEQGTSISIGYIGESYIDFGRVGMFVPIFLLGLFFGGIYQVFIRYQHRAMGMALGTTFLLFGACQIETSCAKLVGGSLIVLLTMSLFLKFFGNSLWNVITRPAPIKSRRSGKGRQRNG